MLESSLDILQCMICKERLKVEVLIKDLEIVEGILECNCCGLKFPIIDRVPILWNDITTYLAERRSLVGKLYQISKSKVMRDYLKNAITGIQYKEDRGVIEDRWTRIYQNSVKSKFYHVIRSKLSLIPRSNIVLEHGCSIGTIAAHLAKSHDTVLGIDRSFSAIWQAKRNHRANLDYFVADSLSEIFSKQFDIVIALNILEIIEPHRLLECISRQISNGYVVITDPYDFERQHVVKRLEPGSLRIAMQQLGFDIIYGTSDPSHIAWNLNLYDRARLCYKVDLIICKTR